MQALLYRNSYEVSEEDQLAKLSDVDKRLSIIEHSISGFRGGLKVAGIFMVIVVLPLCGWVVYTTHALSVSVTAINTTLSATQKQNAQTALRQSVTSPVTSESIRDVKMALDTAKKQNFKLPVKDIQDAGEKLVNASSTNPEAWDTALQLINYRSSLAANDDRLSQAQPQPTRGLITKYKVDSPSGKSAPRMGVIGIVPEDQAAKLEHIGDNLNAGQMGNEFIFWTTTM